MQTTTMQKRFYDLKAPGAHLRRFRGFITTAREAASPAPGQAVYGSPLSSLTDWLGQFALVFRAAAGQGDDPEVNTGRAVALEDFTTRLERLQQRPTAEGFTEAEKAMDELLGMLP